MSVFMLDAGKVEYAVKPAVRELSDPDLQKPFHPRHNCFTSYVIGAHLAAQHVENVYRPKHYRSAEEQTPIHQTIGDTFTIDRYQYPPPFLLLPRLLLATGHDFFQIRTYWFALNVLLFLATSGALLLWLSGHEFSPYWLAWPIVLAAPITLSVLQIGNAHFFIICLSVLAMLAFEKRHDRLGGALLAFAIVSKLFPGMLLVYLLVRRRWSAVIWTCAAMVVLSLATVLTFGVQPFDAFIKFHLPRLVSGDAFGFAREHVRAVAVNLSVIGVPYKLAKLEWLGDVDPVKVAGVVTWVYSGVLVLVTVFSGAGQARRDASSDPGAQPDATRLILARTWFVLLILGQLRSPFLPWSYGNVATLWFLALLVPVRGRWVWRAIALAVGWLVFAVSVPLPLGPATIAFDLLYTAGALLVLLVLCLIVVTQSVFRRSPTRMVPPVSTCP
jgi:hypothetical protein